MKLLNPEEFLADGITYPEEFLADGITYPLSIKKREESILEHY
jgi:hypothetical protein